MLLNPHSPNHDREVPSSSLGMRNIFVWNTYHFKKINPESLYLYIYLVFLF